MAVGITQPGGAGTTIFFEDNAAAPNGLYYTEANFAAAFPVDFVAKGTTPETYQIKVNVQNGDGTGSAVTTWKSTRNSLKWDATKTYLISATGRINRFTEWGSITLSADGEPIGYDGIEAYFGASTTLSGNTKLYGCELRNITASGLNGRILILPTTVGCTSDLVDTDVFTANTQGYGDSNQGLTRIRRLTAAGSGAAGVGAIVQFNCPDADTITISFPNGTRKISTGALITARRVRFVGPSTECDCRATGGAILLDTKWSRNCIKSSAISNEDWVTFNALVLAGIGSPPAPGALVELTDVFGRLVCSAIADANGRITFTSLPSPAFGVVPFTNAILVSGPSGGVIVEYGPFILTINRDRAIAAYPPITKKIRCPGTTFLTTEKEYDPISLVEELVSPAATSGQSYYRQTEIQALLAEFGQTVSIGAESTIGIVERNTIGVAEGRETAAMGIEISIQIETGSLPSLAIGVNISVDGVVYKVSDFKQIGDGATTRIKVALEA